MLPLQAPEAIQEVALVEDQLRVELEPEDIDVGLSVRESVGGEGPPVAYMPMSVLSEAALRPTGELLASKKPSCLVAGPT
jgi:hypothetical protein